MRIIPRYVQHKEPKEITTPPVQKSAGPAPVKNMSEQPQLKTEIKADKKIVQQTEAPKKRSLLEEVIEEQLALDE